MMTINYLFQIIEFKIKLKEAEELQDVLINMTDDR